MDGYRTLEPAPRVERDSRVARKAEAINYSDGHYGTTFEPSGPWGLARAGGV